MAVEEIKDSNGNVIGGKYTPEWSKVKSVTAANSYTPPKPQQSVQADIEEILDNLISSVNTNPDTSNYIHHQEDFKAIKEATQAIEALITKARIDEIQSLGTDSLTWKRLADRLKQLRGEQDAS